MNIEYQGIESFLTGGDISGVHRQLDIQGASSRVTLTLPHKRYDNSPEEAFDKMVSNPDVMKATERLILCEQPVCIFDYQGRKYTLIGGKNKTKE